MKFIRTKIEDLIILEPTVFGDDRGYFLESYNKKNLKRLLVRFFLFKITNQNRQKVF